MRQRAASLLRMCTLLGVGLFALLFAGNEAFALAKKMSISGRLTYRGRLGKSFRWRLRFYESTGIVIGSGRDKDGYAEFFGTYNRVSKHFYMVKHFTRRRGNNKFFYKGKLRRGKLYGTAHRGSYWGHRYATWVGRIRYSRWKFTLGRAKRFALRGKLRYRKGRSQKSFYWRLSYYPSSGRCFGTVRDKDGTATFSGVYDRATKRIFLRKRYDRKRIFYYSGSMTRRGFSGLARRFSFTYRKAYASWSATRLWSWTGGNASPPPARQPRPKMRKFYLRGQLRYLRTRRSKSFSWTLRYYPKSGLCFGEVRDKDGYAKFSGTCNPRTGKLRLTKRFVGRNARFYYTGRITRKGARGLARRTSYRGRAYATWKARLVWRGR